MVDVIEIKAGNETQDRAGSLPIVVVDSNCGEARQRPR